MDLLNYLFIFVLSACDICNEQLIGRKYANFDGVFKKLVISRLNIIDTDLIPKTGLKGPKRACKRATVVVQLWPFWFLAVALLQVRMVWVR